MKKDWWLRAMFLVVVLAILCSMCGCGKLLEGTGNILEAGGQGLTFVGEHLVDTGTEK